MEAGARRRGRAGEGGGGGGGGRRGGGRRGGERGGEGGGRGASGGERQEEEGVLLSPGRFWGRAAGRTCGPITRSRYRRGSRQARRELRRLVGGRYWGPGRFRTALRAAVKEGAATQQSRTVFAPGELSRPSSRAHPNHYRVTVPELRAPASRELRGHRYEGHDHRHRQHGSCHRITRPGGRP